MRYRRLRKTIGACRTRNLVGTSNSTRDVILRTLRARGKCSVNVLAEASGVSPVSVRHHLANLQAESLVAVEFERHGVGRPRQLFSLTESGLDQFPSRYVRLTSRLLDELKESSPPETVEALFSGVANSMAENLATKLAGLPLAERLARMVELLSEEGFEAEVEQSDQRLVIRELSCPYFRIGRKHPEVCTVDQAFIASALALPVERVSCLLHGADSCTFEVALEAPSGEIRS